MSSEQQYERIDAWAVAAPAAAESTISTLAAYLRKGARTEPEACRAIFRWITDRITYDSKGREAALISAGEEALANRYAVCFGFAQLFARVALAARLQAAVISGQARLFLPLSEAAPGELRTNGVVYRGHAWNAVKQEGRWQLIDCTWARARDRFCGKDGSRRAIDPLYYLVPPEWLIRTHLPPLEKWQLLAKPLPAHRHSEPAILYPAFFHYGLALPNVPDGTLRIAECASVEIQYPAGIRIDFQLRGRDGLPAGTQARLEPTFGGSVVTMRMPVACEAILCIYVAARPPGSVWFQAAELRILAGVGMEQQGVRAAEPRIADGRMGR